MMAQPWPRFLLEETLWFVMHKKSRPQNSSSIHWLTMLEKGEPWILSSVMEDPVRSPRKLLAFSGLFWLLTTSQSLDTNIRIKLSNAMELPSAGPTLWWTSVGAQPSVGCCASNMCASWSTSQLLKHLEEFALSKHYLARFQTPLSFSISTFVSLSTARLIQMSQIMLFLLHLIKRKRVLGCCCWKHQR